MTAPQGVAAGPLMVGVAGLALGPGELPLLRHPAVSGVLLFARNFHSTSQLTDLCAAIHAVERADRLLVAVDQEGGRVQRFRDGFTELPPMGSLGERYDQDPQDGLVIAAAHAKTLANELRACGIDFSFAPVLDRRDDRSTVIGPRALHRDTAAIVALASAWLDGLEAVGMAAVAKHFPGHGAVLEDSHEELPVDPREIEEIRATELVPFAALARRLPGMLAAHVHYPALDSAPASFSRRWLHGVLRDELGFDGAVFSDDLGMGAALGLGGVAERVQACIAAGCDVALACNEPVEVMLPIARGLAADQAADMARRARLLRMLPRTGSRPDRTGRPARPGSHGGSIRGRA